MNRTFTLFLILGMIGGIVAGAVFHETLAADQIASVTGGLGIVTTIFLRLIKMIIAPLVFATLVAGIAHMEDAAAVGRIGAKTIAWFIFASLVSLALGLVHGACVPAGRRARSFGRAVGRRGPPPRASRSPNSSPIWCRARSWKRWRTTRSCRSWCSRCFVGTAVAALDDRAPAVLALVEQIAAIMLKVTGYVMMLAPHRGVRGARLDRRHAGRGHPRHLRQVRGRLLCLAACCCGCCCSLVAVGVMRAASGRIARRHARAGAARLFHRQFRGRLSQTAREPAEASACRARSSASCCRSAIRSISTAR